MSVCCNCLNCTGPLLVTNWRLAGRGRLVSGPRRRKFSWAVYALLAGVIGQTSGRPSVPCPILYGYFQKHQIIENSFQLMSQLKKVVSVLFSVLHTFWKFIHFRHQKTMFNFSWFYFCWFYFRWFYTLSHIWWQNNDAVWLE